MDTPIRVLLVGFGLAGQFFHAPLLTRTEGMEMAGVVTSAVAKANAALPGVPVFPDAVTAFREAGAALAVIAAPTGLHAALAEAALRAGLHVVVDKPFTSTLAEAQALAELARAEGRLLTVFQNRRWDADFLEVGRLVREGRLGRVAQFESRYDRFRPEVTDRWRERAGPGAGLWFDLGAHLLDQALVLFGAPEAIRAELAIQRPGGEADDWFHAVLRYPDGLRVILQGGSLLPDHGLRFAVHGTGGSYVKHGLDTQALAMRDGKGPGDAGWGEDPLPGLLTLADGRRESWPVRSPGSYECFYQGVRDAIRQGSEGPVTLDQALTCMTVLEAAVTSSERRAEVPLGPLRF
ncbi:oxidoreductase [Roseomonas sp. OT10]|uniref:oxidoreductase n=1 Tax=Roseomonas cutis TaxID=2897332 RepID=UPI001E55572A|nr:oxidoreductase [Roseomonas sp. OT10]UFN48232.1 oxidoreductase [Roseomonas sp. OT10]